MLEADNIDTHPDTYYISVTLSIRTCAGVINIYIYIHTLSHTHTYNTYQQAVWLAHTGTLLSHHIPSELNILPSLDAQVYKK